MALPSRALKVSVVFPDKATQSRTPTVPPGTRAASAAGFGSFATTRRRLSGCGGEGLLEGADNGGGAATLVSPAVLASAMACEGTEPAFPRFIPDAACGPVRRTTSRASEPCMYCAALPFPR